MQKEKREKEFSSWLMSETVISLSDKVCVCVFTLVLGSLKPHLVLCMYVCVCVCVCVFKTWWLSHISLSTSHQLNIWLECKNTPHSLSLSVTLSFSLHSLTLTHTHRTICKHTQIGCCHRPWLFCPNRITCFHYSLTAGDSSRAVPGQAKVGQPLPTGYVLPSAVSSAAKLMCVKSSQSVCLYSSISIFVVRRLLQLLCFCLFFFADYRLLSVVSELLKLLLMFMYNSK